MKSNQYLINVSHNEANEANSNNINTLPSSKLFINKLFELMTDEKKKSRFN